MKPPLTVEAKVAEELRNWLASELEQLDASNTNQFAHHVVTILLHEDLDIEDEPLSTGDDFLQDIYSINRRKTRDRQKKAAVQFLRSAVCCNESDEAEIQGVVDELMVKIDETKNRMNNKTSKRSLLAPIAINVKTAATQTCSKSDGSEEERLYNEAFPSLAAEESPNKEGLARLNNYSVWNRSSPMGKENNKKKMRRKLCQYAHRQSYMFSCQEEAQACSIAREVAALALAETSLPNAEATEVFPSTLYDSSPSSYSDSSGCWKSAFRTVIFTKVFIPSTTPIQQNRPISSNPISKVFSPKIIQGICGPLFTLSDPSFDFPHTFRDEDTPLKKFHPVYDETTEHLFPQEEDHCLDSGETRFADIEVCKIFTASSHRQEELRSKVQKMNKKAKTKVDTPYQKQKDSELDGALQFPYHCGDFWQELVYKGAVALYPDLNRREKVGSETDGETLMHSRSDTGLASKISVLVTPRAVKDLSLLCLEAIGNHFTPETMKKFVVNYISNVESGCEIRVKPKTLVKCIVDTLLERKEKALLLSRCNITDHRIQEKIYIDQLLHICMATMNEFFPFGPSNMVWSTENMAFVEDAASESMYSNPALSQEEHWKAVDSESYMNGLGYNDVDKINLADGPLNCSSGKLPSNYGDYVAFSCTDEVLESNSGSLDMSDGLFAEDLMYFSEEGGPPSISGFSPSFLDKIDLRYLDDLDARSLENDQTGHFKAALSFKEKILLWRNNVQPAYFIEKWPVACEGFGDEDSWLGQKNSKTEHFDPLSPGYHLTAAMQTADIGTYDQDIGIFSSDQEQLHWENPWSHTKWDSICQEVLTDIMFGCTSWGNHTSPPNPFMPSLLTSCLSTEGAQFLQSAFVNSYFSSNFSGPATPLKESTIAVDCSALEKLWLTKEKQQKSPELEQLWLTKEMQQSFAFGFNSAQYELIRGCTCSNWLENNCKLGLLCPFSHPSI